MDTLGYILENKIVAIARRINPLLIADVAESLVKGGIRLLEVTFDQASDTCITDTVKSIQAVKMKLGDKLLVGAGTVITIEQTEKAREAGADFVLAPNTNIDVIKRAKKLGMVSVPGAFTPTEILTAWDAGADIVKLFPAGNLGLSYFKAIRGPINHIPLMAVGGVSDENVSSFLKAGFCSCGIGSNLVRNDFVEKREFDEITKLALIYSTAARRI